ncbi:MAG: hypothetical protein U0R50_02795 [Gaiellales bacterium]
MRVRGAVLGAVVATFALLALPGVASASQLIGRNATNVQLRVNQQGEALLSYSTAGKRVNVLAWGAINAAHPTLGAQQVKLKLDYAGGWGKYRRNLASSFRNACRPYTGPQLAWFVAGCTAPDGSHWAIQSWQRGLPNLGFDPWKPMQSSWELHLSHWNTELPKLEGWMNWAYSKHFEHFFGRFTYLGQPVFGFASTRKGEPTDTFGRNVYLDTFDSAYGAGWKRENSFLTHRNTGAFCYGFYEHDPYPGYPSSGRRPQGKGQLYRATVIGPGVTPDVTWQGTSLGAYNPQLDEQLKQTQRDVYGSDSLCKPL